LTGESLSEEERRELAEWHSEMDAEEEAQLSAVQRRDPSNEDLRSEIRERLTELQAAVTELRASEEANEALRRQNDQLRQRLVEKGVLAG
jgi:hypothetical protein